VTWLNQASQLVVEGRNSEVALRAITQLTDLDATIRQMEREVPEEVSNALDFNANAQLMTVAELLSACEGENTSWTVKDKVLPDILQEAAGAYHEYYPSVAAAIWIALDTRHPWQLDEGTAEDTLRHIETIVNGMLEMNDRRRQPPDEDEDDTERKPPLSSGTRARLEAIRSAAREPDEGRPRRELAAAE
jgi:hypothetical protein